MRTTVTLDADTQALLQRDMQARGVSFKQALNEAVRAGLGRAGGQELRFPTYDLGVCSYDLTHANRVVADLEDAEIVRELNLGT